MAVLFSRFTTFCLSAFFPHTANPKLSRCVGIFVIQFVVEAKFSVISAPIEII